MHQKALRHSLRNWRNSLTTLQRRKAARLIGMRLRTHPLWRRTRVVAVYAPIRGEAEPQVALMREPSKTLVYPRMYPNGRLKFFKPRSFVRNRLGVRQPRGRAVPLHRMDMLLVPMLAFDNTGSRVGWGGGFYDKTLAQPHRAARVGVAYAGQEVARIETKPHDVKMQWVVTQRQLLRIPP